MITALLALAGCPSKKESAERRMNEAMAKMSEFASRMCDCKDKACADRVQEDMTKWSTEMAKSSPGLDYKPSEAQMKRMTEVGMKFSECMTKQMAAGTVATPEYEPVHNDLPPSAQKRDVDTLIRTARDWMRSTHPQLLLQGITISYADQTGALDDEHGKLYMLFGRSQRSGDDPKRRTGAPVPEAATYDDCLAFVWDARGWTKIPTECTQAWEIPVRCSVTAIWKRALAHEAPADALATIELRTTSDGASWHFGIEDSPRNVHVAHAFPDDCPIVVEK